MSTINPDSVKRICVYCGALPGVSLTYAEGARALAGEMVKRDIALVYGGGKVGLMGIIADEVLRLGGDVTGVIPQALLDMEVGHHALSRLHVVDTMHERKALMAELADGFIAMPGGIGTLEELFETLTWSQLGLHNKPIGLFNINGFFDQLIALLDHLVKSEFLRQHHAALLMEDKNSATLLQRFSDFTAQRTDAILPKDAAAKLLQ